MHEWYPQAPRPPRQRRRALVLLFCSTLLALFPGVVSGQDTGQQTDPYSSRLVRDGIAIELTMAQPEPGRQPTSTLRQGDNVRVRFTMTDTATGTPLSGARPAAWMARRAAGKQLDVQACKSKVKAFLEGNLWERPEVDLNVYYVLALNDDASITVVDPRFGFGGSKLLAMISLPSPGVDWVLTADHRQLFVSLPDTAQVAVIETSSWTVATTLEIGPRPTRLALQPDEAYLWVSYNAEGKETGPSGVAVLSTRDRTTVARIPTGSGHHELAFSSDSRFAFVTNRDDGTVSVIDVRTLTKLSDIPTGLAPTSIAFSTLAQAVYVAHAGDGTIVSLDPQQHTVQARLTAEPGLGQLKMAPGGRLAFVVNPERDRVHILDTSFNRIVQTGQLDKGPDQLAFTDTLAYVRHRHSEIVLMIPLAQVGLADTPVPVVEFPGGQHPLGDASRPSLADAMVPVAGEPAMLVANPADKAIYFYKEGMAAPMGTLSNYGRQPRAVLLVQRHLRERAPGVYETMVRLEHAGMYDLAFLLDRPRLVHCFALEVSPAAGPAESPPALQVESLSPAPTLQVGTATRLQFKVTEAVSHLPKMALPDVQVLIFAPGVWQRRLWAVPAGEGVYTVDFVPPAPGTYTVYLACASQGLSYTYALTLATHSGNGG